MSKTACWLAPLATILFLLAGSLMTSLAAGREFDDKGPPKDLALPVRQGPWIVPAKDSAAEPIWGIDNGIAVGLWPTPGPRGLLRIYAPYMGQPRLRMINYIAVEPIVDGPRGLSELERSKLDNVPGKAMWTAAELDETPEPRPAWQPTQPKLLSMDGTEALTFFIFVEPFQNGARPIVQVTLRQDQPHEVSLRVFSAKDGARMKSCILTATMGNYARLRRLHLKDEVIDSTQLWPGFQATDPGLGGFASHRTWGIDRMTVINGEAIVAATSNEANAAGATYPSGVPPWWRYEGRSGTQYWRTAHDEKLLVRVNGRRTFWGTTADIPGGIAFENFELELPFRPAQEFRFGVTPERPEKLVAGGSP